MRSQGDTKERIGRAALSLFVEQGVAGTSIREIAAKSGLSLGAMYNHFPSKEELAWTLFSDGFATIGRELWRIAREKTTFAEQLAAMIRFVFGEFDTDPERVSFVFHERHQHLQRVGHELANPYLSFRTAIAEAMRRGEIPRRSPDLAAALVTGAIIQVIDTRMLGRLKGGLSALGDEVAARCMALLA